MLTEKKKKVYYQVELTDSETGATSPIDIIKASTDFTAEQYVKGCVEWDDPEWAEIVTNGKVTLIKLDDYTGWANEC